MNDYKRLLAEHLQQAVSALFDKSEWVRCQATDSGLYCDFDLSEPMNPKKLEALSQAMAGIDAPCVFELSGFSGVYRDGDAKDRVLQRVFVTAFENEGKFAAYKAETEKAAERDHKRLGTQLELFSGSENIGAGLILWRPNGAMLRHLLEQFGQNAHLLNGYQWVYSPHIGKAKLWETSGHLDFYRDSMYSPIAIDGEEYYLKPMNCPFHIEIYNSRTRSYRNLPMRLAEYGAVYRYELSGALHGLTRVRGFTQDDAHIICTPEQADSEIAGALKFSLYVLRAFGLMEFKPYISTRPEGKSIGSDEQWNEATETLKKVVTEAGLAYEIDEGGGAFYGPKIDLKLFDAVGREWQCGTIQFDFNLPERFAMRYTGSDGRQHTPVMIHRALFGSIERFTAMLIEHFNGDFPLWLSPVQFAVVPIKERHNAYCKALETSLKKLGLRTTGDYADANMREKIKRFELEKIPYILVVGDRDIERGGCSVRSRKDGSLGFMTLEQLREHIKPELEAGVPKYILDT